MIGVLLTVLALVVGAAEPYPTTPHPSRSAHSSVRTRPTPSRSTTGHGLRSARAGLRQSHTANPRSNYRAARKFLTRTASAQWDSSGDMVVVDEVNVFIDERSATTVRLRLVGDNVGTLRPDGQLLPATGRVAATFDLRRVNDQWRIDGRLPNGTLIDKNQFESLKPLGHLYFPNSDRTARARPALAVRGHRHRSGHLVQRLIAGPSTDLRAAAGTAFATPLRGKVSAVRDGGSQVPLTGVGGLSDTDEHVMVAQIVYTFEGLEIGGPHQITDDGVPLRTDRPKGWKTTDVEQFDPEWGGRHRHRTPRHPRRGAAARR